MLIDRKTLLQETDSEKLKDVIRALDNELVLNEAILGEIDRILDDSNYEPDNFVSSFRTVRQVWELRQSKGVE